MKTSQQTPLPSIVLHSIGTHTITAGKHRITPRQRKLFALALYLILERGKNISRETLRRMFWPDEKDPSEAKQALRQLMHKLRIYGFPIPDRADSIKLPQDFATADIDSLENQTFDKAKHVAFLVKYNPEISDDFTEWLHLRREIVHKRIGKHLLSLGNKERKRHNWRGVIALADLCLQVQEYKDEAHYLRAEAMAVLNSSKDALDNLNKYKEKLSTHIDGLSSHKLLLRIEKHFPKNPYFSLRTAEITGRSEDINRIHQFIDLIRQSVGGGFLILGEAGIGKSRLAEEALRYALITGALVEVIKCQQGDEHTPLSVFMNLIPQLRGLSGSAGCRADTKKILDRITVHEPYSAVNHDADESETIRTQLKFAIKDLMDAIAHEQPLLLIVENMQWMDKASTELLNDLMVLSQGKQVGILLTSRSPYSDCTGLPTPACLTTRTLDGLLPEETRYLAREIVYAHGKNLDNMYVNDVSILSGGNPYFLHELIKQWVDTGERYLAPPSLKSILNERISRTNPEALHVLQTVALLGRHATRERINYVLGHKGEELNGVFKELDREGMLIDQEDIVQSRHNLLTTEVIDRIPANIRKNLHKRIAHILEKELEGQIDVNILWDCAHHFEQAEDMDQARWIMMLCGRHIAKIGYQKDAADTFGRALTYCIEDKDKLALLHMMAVAQNASGMHSACVQSVAQIQKLAAKVDSTHNHHDEYELLALHSSWKSMEDWGKTMAMVRYCIWDEAASEEHKVQAAVIGLKIASDTGDKYIIEEMHRSVSGALRSNTLNRELKLEFELIHATMNGSLKLAMKKAKELVTVTPADAPIQKQINRKFNCAVPFLRAGNFSTGRLYLDEALSLAERYHLHKMMVLMASKLVYNYLATEKPVEARAVFTRVDKIKDHIKDEPVTYQFLMRLGEQIALVEAELDGVAPADTGYLPLLDPQATAGNARLDEMALYVHRRLLEGSKPETIADIVEEMIPLYKNVRIVGGQDYTTYVLVKGLQAIGKTEQGARLLREYVDGYRLEAWPMVGKLLREVELIRSNLYKTEQSIHI